MKSGGGGKVRIIGGVLKRTPLVVAGDADSMRPTPDRVRETLFNWLGEQVVDAACLDLFAGSGALGLEAASRGAGQVIFNENDGRAARQLQARIDTLGQASDVQVKALAGRLSLSRQDALAALASHKAAGRRFDLIFIDPPFAEPWLDRLAGALPAVLCDDGLVYVEQAREVETLAGFSRLRHGRAGQVHYHLFCYSKNPQS